MPVCILCGSELPDFLVGDSHGPLLCCHHGRQELLGKGIVGTMVTGEMFDAPASVIRGFVIGRSLVELRLHPELLYVVLILDDDSAVLTFPVGSSTVGAQLLPKELVSRTIQGLESLSDAPDEIRKGDKDGLLCAIDRRIPITDVAFGRFLDGAQNTHMLPFCFHPDYWREFETGNWLTCEPATKLFFDWRDEPPRDQCP